MYTVLTVMYTRVSALYVHVSIVVSVFIRVVVVRLLSALSTAVDV
jgi:hypothetical protein